MKNIRIYLLALTGILLSSGAMIAQPDSTNKETTKQGLQSFDFWTITNDTHRPLTITSDKETVTIEPGETEKLSRDTSFRIKVEHIGWHGNRHHINHFTIKKPTITIYSRYHGRLGIETTK